DQSIMWNGALEMLHGHFHEPCFYGQAYNTMLESLLAVPLLWLGVGPAVALPLTTSVLTLFPFALLAWVLARRREYALAALMLVFPVLLPPEFGMITSLSRGFVTGVFLSSLAVLPLFSKRGVFLLLSPFFAILALFANPNAALVLAPAGLLIVLRYHADRRPYLLGAIGALPALVLYYLGHHFYELRPNYVVHTMWDLQFRAADIRWADLRFMDELDPLLWGKGWFVLVLLSLLGVILGKARQWKAVIALLFGTMLLLLSFGVNKIHDGLPSVFYPWARMFLAIPFLLVLFASQLKWRPARWVLWLMPLLAAGFFSFKCVVLNAAVERQVASGKETDVVVAKVADLKTHCMMIAHIARAEHAQLIVVGLNAGKQLTNYGCPCLVKDFPATMEPLLDRRSWWLKANAPLVVPNVLFAEFWEGQFAGKRSVERVSQDPLIYVLKNNSLRTDSLLAHLGIKLRPY
ncbi:MAG: hypothetical protein ABI373_07160, partial [Flavobacteriales bacterium]